MASLAETIRELRRITGGSHGCGWMCDEVAEFLHSLVKFTRPDLVIQTGHLWGKSAAAILTAFGEPEPIEDQPQDADKRFSGFVDANRPSPSGQKLISIDPHPIDVPHPGKGIAWLTERFSFEFRRQKSSEFFRDFKPEPGSKIMGVVDGDHSDEGCDADLQALGDWEAQTIVVDDVCWLPSLETVAHAFARKNGYDMAVFRQYNGIAVLTR